MREREREGMELAGRAMSMVSRLLNNNVFIDVCLLGSFGALALRSMNQEKLIETLESEKETLSNTNKAMKKTLWDSKQQLYDEASSPDTAIVPLSRLKAIYGEVVTVPSGNRHPSFYGIFYFVYFFR